MNIERYSKFEGNYLYAVILNNIISKVNNHFSKNKINDIKGFLKAYENQINQYFKSNKNNIDGSIFLEESKEEFIIMVLDQLIIN